MSTCNRLDRLANTRMSTDYAQKSPPSLVDTTETKPLTHFIATIRTPQYSTLSEYIYMWSTPTLVFCTPMPATFNNLYHLFND